LELVLTQYLSNESLLVLDQAPALKSDEEYFTVLCHIESLESFEKKVFLRYLEKENKEFVDKYKEDLKYFEAARQKKIQEARQNFLEEQQKEDEKNKEKFQKKWPAKAIYDRVRKQNPYYCGIQFVEDFRYYKFFDFEEAINIAYDIISGGYELLIALPSFFEFLENYREGENIPLYSPNTNYVLCYSEVSRQEYMEGLKQRNIERDKSQEEFGFIKVEE